MLIKIDKIFHNRFSFYNFAPTTVNDDRTFSKLKLGYFNPNVFFIPYNKNSMDQCYDLKLTKPSYVILYVPKQAHPRIMKKVFCIP